jgi:hypothetical protein
MGTRLAGHRDGLLAVVGDADHLDVPLLGQVVFQPHPDGSRVVGDEDAEGSPWD